MKRLLIKKISIVIFSFIVSPLFALEIHIAPISFIDTIEERVFSRREIAREIASGTEKYLEGKNVFFREIRNQEVNAPVSVIDAINVGGKERVEYLLYGFIEKRAHTYRAEVKLLDFENRRIRKIFYSSDDIENYERLIKDLSYKIVSYFDSVFAFGIAAEEPGRLMLSIPLSFGYWNCLNPEWMNAVIGTGAVSTGINLITNDRRFSNLKQRAYLSWNLNIEYRYGIGKEDVELEDVHIASLSFPIRVHIESLSREGGFFFGVGLQYEFYIANIEETYAEANRFLYTHMGVLGTFGYQRRISKRMRMAFDNIVDVGFREHPMISYSPRIRMLYCIYAKERTDKWR
ncbi:MAG: hypothetical protein FWD87_10765 [Spirochaetaceae bacterium]|nr:hypothetical protein [Spirochaetaceae bacterium]